MSKLATRISAERVEYRPALSRSPARSRPRSAHSLTRGAGLNRRRGVRARSVIALQPESALFRYIRLPHCRNTNPSSCCLECLPVEKTVDPSGTSRAGRLRHRGLWPSAMVPVVLEVASTMLPIVQVVAPVQREPCEKMLSLFSPPRCNVRYGLKRQQTGGRGPSHTGKPDCLGGGRCGVGGVPARTGRAFWGVIVVALPAAHRPHASAAIIGHHHGFFPNFFCRLRGEIYLGSQCANRVRSGGCGRKATLHAVLARHETPDRTQQRAAHPSLCSLIPNFRQWAACALRRAKRHHGDMRDWRPNASIS